MDNGKAKTRAFAHSLRREERVEDAHQHFGWDAHSVVDDIELGIVADAELAMKKRPLRVDHAALQSHLQDACLAHRLHRVRAEIHDDLVDLRRIANYGGRPRLKLNTQIYAGG